MFTYCEDVNMVNAVIITKRTLIGTHENVV